MDIQVYYPNFINVSAFDAVCTTTQGDRAIVLEIRKMATGKMELFTIIDDHSIRAASLQEFLLLYQSCLRLSIRHTIPMIWRGESTQAELTEIYTRSHEPSSSVSIQLNLKIKQEVYETEATNSISEAIQDLDDLISKDNDWHIQTCLECSFGYPADKGPGWDDRDGLRCLRDAAPEAVENLRLNPQAMPVEIYLTVGHCFVHAFHYCAAWKPWRLFKQE